MNQPFERIIPEGSIEPFEHPTIKEILEQQRIILENLSELMKAMAHPSVLYKSEVSKKEFQK